MKKRDICLMSALFMIIIMTCAVLSGCKTDLPDFKTFVSKREKAEAVVPDGEWGLSVAGAYNKSNCVNTRYNDSTRSAYIIENSNMKATYDLETGNHRILSNLTSPSGAVYVEETDDVFVRTEDGAVFYSSMSSKKPRANMFRHGLYYSDVRILDSNFTEKKAEGDTSSKKKVRLTLDHTFHLYADRLNSVCHVVGTANQEGIAAIGMITRIKAETVDAVAVKDASGLNYYTDSVVSAQAEYVGFHIKGAGVLGYILLPDESSGTLRIETAEGYYIVTQERTPENGTLKKNEEFYLGRRIYTDSAEDFTAFISEAEYERHPLTDISCDTYSGYDALRGAYVINMDSTGFNQAFFDIWNEHFPKNVSVTNTGDRERSIYILTTSTSGCLEGSAILDESEEMLPIRVEVHKNFCGENEETTFDRGDTAYGEGLFPLTLKAGQKVNFTVLNLFQNWGKTPLKQLSSIQFGAPYYHLSTGVTETTCIAPWYVGWQDLWTLTDFRPMSAPFWYEMEGEYYGNQPQHTHGGYQYFLKYKTAEGERYATELIENEIISAGPTYASVKMTYLSDDGKIRVTYTHTEMPQTDENRCYYEMSYEILDDISFENFKRDFQFYSAYAYAGHYRTVGYLDNNNNYALCDTVSSSKDKYVKLGKNCPYFSLYHYQEDSHNGFIDNGNNTNLGCAVKDFYAVIGGRKYNGNLVMALNGYGARLTLDLKKVTLKKGDRIQLNMIISPWGYQLSDSDENVRNIREYSCLNPLTVSCDASQGSVLQNGFLPALRTNNGISIDFTVSGGINNSVIRLYGFEECSGPSLYELIDGEWVYVNLSSSDNPDHSGNAHTYDGYTVYYDGDGTYSYAFAVEMTGTERTFRFNA